ncbi:Sua5/YciO/YrdC/YwlC family protein [Cyanobium sp. FGCU-52]|nr:Sua5/YciO/YrdC/YwlC family protein [Cyanobium sp. FGCU52]
MSPLLSVPDLAAALQAGSLALFPTDTLPALATTPGHAAAIWTCKARPREKPLILMGADLPQLVDFLGVAWLEPWLEKAQTCWPGAVTLVLPIQGPVTEALHPGGTSLGLRVPACERALELLRRTGPLATTSANRSGEPAARDAREAAALFPEIPQLAPLPWPPGSGSASTVLAWSAANTGTPVEWQTLRAGATVPRDEGRAAC